MTALHTRTEKADAYALARRLLGYRRAPSRVGLHVVGASEAEVAERLSAGVL